MISSLSSEASDVLFDFVHPRVQNPYNKTFANNVVSIKKSHKRLCIFMAGDRSISRPYILVVYNIHVSLRRREGQSQECDCLGHAHKQGGFCRFVVSVSAPVLRNSGLIFLGIPRFPQASLFFCSAKPSRRRCLSLDPELLRFWQARAQIFRSETPSSRTTLNSPEFLRM